VSPCDCQPAVDQFSHTAVFNSQNFHTLTIRAWQDCRKILIRKDEALPFVLFVLFLFEISNPISKLELQADFFENYISFKKYMYAI
jgi:hypothetical protein